MVAAAVVKNRETRWQCIRNWANLDDVVKPQTVRSIILGNSRSGIVSEKSPRPLIESKPSCLPTTYRISS